jgi:hypothetical protein
MLILLQAIAERTFDLTESVAVSAVASLKKVSDETTGLLGPEPEVAGIVAPIHDSVTVSETVVEERSLDLSSTRATTQTAEIVSPLKESVSISQVMTESSVQELHTQRVSLRKFFFFGEP